MKPLFLFLVALSCNAIGYTQYEITQVSADGINGKIGSFSFTNELTGYYFSGQKIMKTTNGGDTWDVFVENFNLLKPIGANYITGQFLNETTGWVVLQKLDQINYINDSSYLYKTVDGGQSWTLLHLNPPNYVEDAAARFSHCYFKDEMHGWVYGWGLLQATEDGGATWTDLYLNDTNVSNNRVITDMCMNNSGELFVSGWGAWIMKFTGNGSDLTDQHYYGGGNATVDDYYLNGITFLNSDTGFVASRHSTVKRTFNGGITWQDLTTGFIHDNNDITIAPDNTIWLASGDYCNNTGCYHSKGILYSTDLGNTWAALVDENFVNERFVKIIWPSENYGLASTIKGQIHKITKAPAGLTEGSVTFEIYPNPVENILSVQTDSGVFMEMQLKDINGKQLLTANSNTIDISSLPAGIYFISVTTELGTYIKKIMKE